jgi:hypothetical protein
LIRVVRLVTIAIVIEACLVAVAHLQPAMAGLFRSVYWLVGGAFLVAIVRAMRHRRHGDRRHADRRHSVPEER